MIKDADAHVRFTFLTGVSKVSKVSLFSGLNNLTDMAQLKARRYADKYRDLGEPIHLVGVEFSREARNVVGFEVERA